jgi:hypothetical protein
LSEKHLRGIETLRDSWGNNYDLDAMRGLVYSKGPNGKHNSDDPDDLVNLDDVIVSYRKKTE